MSRAKPGKGKVRLGEHSSLRKLMRAARRGKLEDDRLGVIQRAVASAVKRQLAGVFSNSTQRRGGCG